MRDSYNRNIDYLRISVTDRCNMRCIYCMPKEGVDSIAHSEILSFEEIIRVCTCASQLGIKKIKITGGEPLVRKDIPSLIKQIKKLPLIEEVTLTTNGVLLYDRLDELVEAGLDAINMSLNTQDAKKYLQITRTNQLEQVTKAILKASRLPFKAIKINCLAIKGFNEEELVAMALLAKDNPIHVRFIELMPLGFGKDYKAVYQDEILQSLERTYGEIKPSSTKLGNGPGMYYEIKGFRGKIGFVSAVSHEFCTECNRIRLTADGILKLCLHIKDHINLKELLRGGLSDKELIECMREAIYHKPLQHSFNKVSQENQLEDRAMVKIGG